MTFRSPVVNETVRWMETNPREGPGFAGPVQDAHNGLICWFCPLKGAIKTEAIPDVCISSIKA